MSDLDLDDLRSELEGFAQPEKKTFGSQREQRILAGFEEIQRFVDKEGHAPQHGEEKDIFERLYAVRLDRLRQLEECRTLLEPFDHQGLLSGAETTADEDAETMDEDQLMAELAGMAGSSDITDLRHVRPRAEVKAAEEIGKRKRCEDFEIFKPKFDAVQQELKEGLRETKIFRKKAGFVKTDIELGHFIILGGQTCYIADIGEPITAPNGEYDARLRVIYSNGTEGDILLRTLIRAMYRDEASRLITEPSAGPLFADQSVAGDEASGTIYVLRSKSDHPEVAKNREALHKIGVTGGTVESRIANAKLDPTFLMADVEIVQTYKLFNINRAKLENLIHRIFDAARLDIKIKDRFGLSVTPREWFLVPAFVIDEAVEKIREGTITSYIYDPSSASLVRRSD